MSGLVGIVTSNQDPSIGDALRRMANTLDYPAEIREMGNAAFAVAGSAIERLNSLPTGDDAIELAFWGQLWDREGVIKRANLGSVPADDIPLGLLLRHLYRNEGLNGLCKLNGRFAIALWDKNEETLQLISDRYGFCKLFYCASAGGILFASEYKAIVQHEDFPATVDEEAIADFMSLGYCLEERTFFENIRLLPYGSVLTFHKGRVSTAQYWDYTFGKGNNGFHDLPECVDQYYGLLGKACKKQIEGKKIIGLPLSGGLDSRALAGMLNKLDFQGSVKTFSYGNADCFDVVYGKRIAGRVGYSHEYIPIESTYLRDNAERFVWLTEGTVNCLNAHMMLTHGVIRKGGIEAIITGFLGDTVAGEPIAGLDPFKESLTEDDFIRRLFNAQTEIMSDDDAAKYFHGGFYERMKGRTFASFKADYLRAPSESRYCRSIYAELIGRQRRYTSFNLHAFERVAEVLSPFTDNDFVDFSLQIPDDWAMTRLVEKEMLVKYLPKAASVPWNKTRLPLNSSKIRKGLHWRWERLNRNPLVRATIGRRYARMHDNYLNSAAAIRTGSRDFVVSHIRDNPFLAEYFNMDRVHQTLDDHMSGTRNEQGKITAFLTLSLWHKLFIEGKGFKRATDFAG